MTQSRMRASSPLTYPFGFERGCERGAKLPGKLGDGKETGRVTVLHL